MYIRSLLAVALLSVASLAGAATTLEVVLPDNSTTGVAFSFTVTARNGAAIDAAYVGTVHFTSSDAGATLPADYTFTPGDAGTRAFNATMATAGPDTSTRNQTMTATDTVTTSVTGTDVTTVKWAPDVVRQIRVEVPETVDRNAPFTGLVSAVNADYGVVPGYLGTVHFIATTGITVPADYSFTSGDGGVHPFTFSATRGGSHVISVTDLAEPSLGSSDSSYVNCPELTASAANNGPVCANGSGSTILIGSSNQAGVSFSWTGPHTYFSFEQNPTATIAGTYFLEVTNPDGCHAFAETTVAEKEVHPPTVSAPSRICGGDTVTMTITDASSYSDFLWLLDGPGTIVSGQGTPSIQVAAGIPATHSNIVVNATATYIPSGCRTGAFIPIDVDREPTADILTPGSACPHATLTASVPEQPGMSYLWTVTNGTITNSTGSSIQYVVNDSGEATIHVTATNQSGSCESTDTAIVTLNGPTATLGATTLATCPTQQVEIPVVLSGSAPFMIQWSDGFVQSGITTATATRMVAPPESTMYAITSVTDALCAGAATGATEVLVDAAPLIATPPRNVAIQSGARAELTVDAPGPNLRFDWYEGPSGDRSHPVASGSASSFRTRPLDHTTSYWVEVTNTCGTSVQSPAAIVSVSTKRRAARH